MRLPRDISGRELESLLFKRLGYRFIRQKGSHRRLRTETPTANPVTVPDHKTISVGTLRVILRGIAQHLDCDIDDVALRLFGDR